MSILNLVLDLLLVVLFIICIIICTKRGLVKSLFKSLRVFVSFLIAAFLNNTVGSFVKTRWIGTAVHDWVYGLVSPKIEESGNAVSSLVSSIPPSVKNILDYFGFSIDEAASNAASKLCRLSRGSAFHRDQLVARLCRSVFCGVFVDDHSRCDFGPDL